MHQQGNAFDIHEHCTDILNCKRLIFSVCFVSMIIIMMLRTIIFINVYVQDVKWVVYSCVFQCFMPWSQITPALPPVYYHTILLIHVSLQKDCVVNVIIPGQLQLNVIGSTTAFFSSQLNCTICYLPLVRLGTFSFRIKNKWKTKLQCNPTNQFDPIAKNKQTKA